MVPVPNRDAKPWHHRCEGRGYFLVSPADEAGAVRIRTATALNSVVSENFITRTSWCAGSGYFLDPVVLVRFQSALRGFFVG